VNGEILVLRYKLNVALPSLHFRQTHICDLPGGWQLAVVNRHDT